MDNPVDVLISFPPDIAAPFQFSAALANLEKWFLSKGLTRSECATVMEFHVNLSKRYQPDWIEK